MTRKEKIAELKAEIGRQITPLIQSDYVLLDLPYHSNIGDTLIWEGELRFLGGLPYRMKGWGSLKTWGFPPLDSDTTVLLHGGGNFGDVWESPHMFRLKAIEKYRDNPIVIFPQTVYYNDPGRASRDAELFARHPRLTICARDRVSCEFLRKHFTNNILLVPDMAFCIPPQELEYKGCGHYHAASLLIDRTDKERASAASGGYGISNADVRDWPTMEKTGFGTWSLYKMSEATRRLNKLLPPSLTAITDRTAAIAVKNSNVRAGVDLLGPYDDIHTTRLHGAILAILMDKPVHIIDNCYGKNGWFYDSWLAGTEGVEMVAPATPD